MIDWDLKERVSSDTTTIIGTKPHFSGPILRFQETFYHMCDKDRFEKFGYSSIYDALAYLLAESKSSGGKKIKLTKPNLRALGLDEDDLKEIQTLESRYRA